LRVALICNGDIPPYKYGGTQRVVAWLAKGLLELGIYIYIISDGQVSIKHRHLKHIYVSEGINNLRNNNEEKKIY